MTDFRALCAELLQLEQEQPAEYTDWKRRYNAAIARVRAALAQPEPQGPTDEEARELANDLGITRGYFDHECGLHISCADLAPFAEFVLTRWGRPAIEPVPVAERPWEREGWCDADGKCALFSPALLFPASTWLLAPAAWAERFPDIYTHSLPHHALPVPQQGAGR